MMTDTDPIPDTYHRVTPGLNVEDASEALQFYEEVFGATELMRIPGPDGTIAHSEIEIGDSVVMVDDAMSEMGTQAPPSLGGSPCFLYLYVEDVDAIVDHAVTLGAEVTQPAEDQFYGDRVAHVEDPFGHVWSIATHVEDVEPEEMKRRAAEWQEEAGPG